MEKFRGRVFLLLGLLGGGWGCSSPNPHVRVHRLPDGRLEVQGPLAGPFKNTETLAAQACELMTRQPGAAFGAHGKEYCALGYLDPEERAYYLSYLSDIGGEQEGGKKFCTVPSVLDDPSRENVLILIRLHTHPHNRRFSREDLSAGRRWDATRLLDKKTGHLMERYLLVLYREKAGECRSYQYNYATRIVSALREEQWVSIGKVVSDGGSIEMVEGQDWVP